MHVMKIEGKQVQAYELGAGTEMEKALIQSGRIKKVSDDTYEVFSQECHGEHGERAKAGDYFKTDSSGAPYPNMREWFEANHRRISGDLYEQIPQQLEAWEVKEGAIGQSEVMDYLIDAGRIIIHPEDEKHYFEADLWGTMLSATKDAVIVFYQIVRDSDGKIQSVDFNFVARDEFEKDYRYC